MQTPQPPQKRLLHWLWPPVTVSTVIGKKAAFKGGIWRRLTLTALPSVTNFQIGTANKLFPQGRV